MASVLGINGGLTILLSYVQAFDTSIATVTLLVGGIMFLKGRGYPVLLYGTSRQAALVILGLISSLINKYANTNGIAYLGPVIGSGPVSFTIYLIFTPATKQWKQ